MSGDAATYSSEQYRDVSTNFSISGYLTLSSLRLIVLPCSSISWSERFITFSVRSE